MVSGLTLRNRPSEEVGYGKPPRHTQFKPGQSGNPRGRPKGALNVGTVLERTLREQVVVNEGGRRKRITKLDAAIKQLVNKAASGNQFAIRLLLTLAQHADDRPPVASGGDADLPEADQRVLTSILSRFKQTKDETES